MENLFKIAKKNFFYIFLATSSLFCFVFLCFLIKYCSDDVNTTNVLQYCLSSCLVLSLYGVILYSYLRKKEHLYKASLILLCAYYITDCYFSMFDGISHHMFDSSYYEGPVIFFNFVSLFKLLSLGVWGFFVFFSYFNKNQKIKFVTQICSLVALGFCVLYILAIIILVINYSYYTWITIFSSIYQLSLAVLVVTIPYVLSEEKEIESEKVEEEKKEDVIEVEEEKIDSEETEEEK